MTAARDDRAGRAPVRPGQSAGEIVAAACARERAGQSHGETGQALKTLIEQRRRGVVSGYARGDVAAARLSDIVEEAIVALFAEGAKSHPAAAKRLALAAVGGFGRGELAPYSDVDLLFLHPAGDAGMRPLLDFILYPLWDAGLKVGHAVHAPATAVAFAREDMVARTAYLDARLLCGEAALFRDFRARYDGLRRRTKKQFAAAKRAELEARHAKSEQTRYLAEPDLKEGKGGLRDLQTIAWLYKYEYAAALGAPGAPKKLLTPEQLRTFRRCARFLWAARFQLHDLVGRAEEKLSFDVQPALAERLGYADRGGMLAAERLMKDYFVNAMEVGRLTRIAAARLDEERERLSPKALKVLPKTLARDEAGEKANLKLVHGRLHFASPARARRQPADLFRLFRAFSKRPDYDFHPDALALAASAARLVTPQVRADPVIAKLFLATLVEAKDPVKTLRLMAETGLLGRYIPAFGKIIGRIEYGLHRRYSIDENVFRSIGVLAEIERGAARERHPVASKILDAAPARAPFYLAVLLHETIWGMREKDGGACERLVARIARRLGLEAEDAALVGWAAARPHLMIRTVERRNLAEPRAVARFAETVGDRRRLDLLLVLSVCHQRVVGVDSWDEWTRRQLTELYESAAAFLDGGEAGLAAHMAARAEAARAAARAQIEGWPDEEKDAFLAGLSDEIMRALDPEIVARVGALARSAAGEGRKEAVALRARDDGDVEAVVYARDRLGLLADLAGAIAACGVSVRNVQVLTSAGGQAIDVFTLQSEDENPLDDPNRLRRLHARLLEAARAAPDRPRVPARRLGDRRAIFDVEPAVRIDLEWSQDCTVVEAEGRDRPGLLYDLTAALAEIGVGIVSAHIATYGARAVDAFYLQDAPGYKIANRRRLQSIERRLLAALRSG